MGLEPPHPPPFRWQESTPTTPRPHPSPVPRYPKSDADSLASATFGPEAAAIVRSGIAKAQSPAEDSYPQIYTRVENTLQALSERTGTLIKTTRRMRSLLTCPV